MRTTELAVFRFALLVVGFVPLGWSASTSASQLKFELTTLFLSAASLGDENIHGDFRFKNVGNRTITITKVVASCTCTDYGLDKATVGPGETGLLVASVDLKKKGAQTNVQLVVYTDDTVAPIFLNLVVKKPSDQLVVAPPRFLIWRVGEEKKPKRVLVFLSKDANVKLTAVTTRGPSAFSGKVVRDEANPEKLWIEITPNNTDQKYGETFYPVGKGLEPYGDMLRIYAAVWPPPRK